MEKTRMTAAAWSAFAALSLIAGSSSAVGNDNLSSLKPNDAEARLFVTGGSQGVTQKMINERDATHWPVSKDTTDNKSSAVGQNEAEVRLFVTGASQGITQNMINHRDVKIE